MTGPRDIQAWLDAYGESHRHAVNELIHWLCVPIIFFCVVGLLVSIPSPLLPWPGDHLWAKAAIALVLWFYAMRSLTLLIGMALWCGACFGIALLLENRCPWPLWSVCVVLFVIAWIGQFIGHRIEGKKPSFLDDVRFLLIGPAWLMAKIYRRIGIRV